MNAKSELHYVLKLFITGRSPRSQNAIRTLQSICDQDLGGQFELEIVDVLEHPEEAEERKILATPTVVKDLPPPIRKVIGDLSDKDKVLVGLDLRRMEKE
jgi:circadian clock protein KaiB